MSMTMAVTPWTPKAIDLEPPLPSTIAASAIGMMVAASITQPTRCVAPAAINWTCGKYRPPESLPIPTSALADGSNLSWGFGDDQLEGLGDQTNDGGPVGRGYGDSRLQRQSGGVLTINGGRSVTWAKVATSGA